MAAITREQIAHLARLARLAVTDADIGMFAGQLDTILHAVARVGEVVTADIAATSHAVPLVNVWREDVPAPGLTQAQALSGAPQVSGGRFRVPHILTDGQTPA